MIGLAVGIDYTLFILSRYRTELHHTDDRQEAVGRAVGTAGSAVVFAGLTVLIALSALAIVRIPFLTSMGLAAAGTVFMAVLVALTLLPAILGMLRSKAFAGRVRRERVERDADGRLLNNGVRWARLARPGARRGPADRRRRARRAGPAGAQPAPGAAQRLDGGPEHDAAPGLRPDQRRVRSRPRGAAAGRRGRARRRRGGPRCGLRRGRRTGPPASRTSPTRRSSG